MTEPACESSLCPMCERVGYPVNDCPTCTAKQWLCSRCDHYSIGGICTHCRLRRHPPAHHHQENSHDSR